MKTFHKIKRTAREIQSSYKYFKEQRYLKMYSKIMSTNYLTTTVCLNLECSPFKECLGLALITPSISQRENGICRSWRCSNRHLSWHTGAPVLHRGLFKPSPQVHTVLFVNYPHISFLKTLERMSYSIN